MQDKLYDVCYSCGEKNKKREMITILARSKRGEQPKQFCFMCRKCFERFCKENGIDPHNIILKGDKYMLENKKQNKALDKAISVCDADIKYNLRYIDKHGDEHVIKFNTESEMKAKAQQAKLKGMENIIAEIVENGSIRKSYKLS